MATVFEETNEVLPETQIAALLLRPEFWAIAAVRNGTVIGGLTAHTLMMTNSPEVFIFDIAVDPRSQREGVGRQLVEVLREKSKEVGIDTVFVAADNDDTHAPDLYRSIGAAGSPVTMFSFDADSGSE